MKVKMILPALTEAFQHLVGQFAADDTLGLHRHRFGC